MEISYDPERRKLTLEHRGLDMAQADDVFAGATITIADDRKDYGEDRFITIGHLQNRMVILVWTPREKTRRIISMRKANDREQALYSPRLA
jgi:uncharacterized protein